MLELLEFTNSFSYANECPIQAAKHMETKLVKPIHPGDQEIRQEWHDTCLREGRRIHHECELNQGDFMSSLGRVVLKMGLLSLLSVMPLAAQMIDGINFTTSFPFYAGNARMPAGTYRISQSDVDSSVLQIQSVDGAYSAFIEFVPTHAEQPHPQTDVTFHKYGDTDYLNRIWVNGQRYGMKVDATKAETKAAAHADVIEHSLVASN
jgi:hypothetical protein